MRGPPTVMAVLFGILLVRTVAISFLGFKSQRTGHLLNVCLGKLS